MGDLDDILTILFDHIRQPKCHKFGNCGALLKEYHARLPNREAININMVYIVHKTYQLLLKILFD